jgi:hypothetical protein
LLRLWYEIDAATIKTDPNPTNDTAYMRNGKAATAAASLNIEKVVGSV